MEEVFPPGALHHFPPLLRGEKRARVSAVQSGARGQHQEQQQRQAGQGGGQSGKK